MTFEQIRLILRARITTAAFAFIVVVGLVAAVTFLIPKTYEATADVIVDVRSPDPLAGVLPTLAMSGYMATQVDIITSNRVALLVVKQLKLDEDEDYLSQWKEDARGNGAIDYWIAAKLLNKLSVKPSRESNVMSIVFRASSPERAAQLANAFAQAYIQTTIELRVAPAKEYSKWFQEQGALAREVLEAAQTKLSAYQRENGIVLSEERLDIELNKLNELSSQLSSVQGESADSAGKRNLINAAETLPDVIQNPLIQELKSDLVKLESQLQEDGRNLGVNHPVYQQLQAQADTVRQKINSETKRIVDSIVTSNLASKGKEAQLGMVIQAQKNRILELKSQRDALAVLEHDVETAQKAYDAISQKITQANLESQTNQTNVALLTAAVPPFNPSSPKIVLNMLGSVFLGMLVGLGMVLLRELLDRRVRGGVDLVEILGVPVLAEFTHQCNFKKLPASVASPEKVATASNNKLVVPAHADDI